MYFLLHPLSFWDWTRDQKIQFLILIAFLLGFLWSMFVEIPKLRRGVELLGYEVDVSNGEQRETHGGTNQITRRWSRIKIYFSNKYRRPIRITNMVAYCYDGLVSRENSHPTTLNEGENDDAYITFDWWFCKNNLKKIEFTDSLNKKHIFYFYKGNRSWFVGRVKSFLWWYFKLLKI